MQLSNHCSPAATRDKHTDDRGTVVKKMDLVGSGNVGSKLQQPAQWIFRAFDQTRDRHAVARDVTLNRAGERMFGDD